jgi:hypothetical protein
MSAILLQLYVGVLVDQFARHKQDQAKVSLPRSSSHHKPMSSTMRWVTDVKASVDAWLAWLESDGIERRRRLAGKEAGPSQV